MKEKLLMVLISLLFCLNACAKQFVYQPDTLIPMYVGKDKFLIPLQHIVRPNTGSLPIIRTETRVGYFFWSSGRGLTNDDINPEVLEKDVDIVKMNWNEHNAGMVGNSMINRIQIIKNSDTRYTKADRSELEAYLEKNPEFQTVTFIGKIDETPVSIKCQNFLKNETESYCQMNYIYPKFNNHISLTFYGKNLPNWKKINEMAIKFLNTWYQPVAQ